MNRTAGTDERTTGEGRERKALPLEVQVGRLFMVGMPAQGRIREAMEAHDAHYFGGVFLNRDNLRDADRTRRLTHRFRRRTRNAPPMIVGADEEGGLVTNISHLTTPAPSAAALGVIDDEEVTRDVYEGIGAKLRALGFNTVFAPVLDVNVEAANPVIGTRSFGVNPVLVGRHGVAALEGLQAAGIAACVKHFPGHGATTVDSHRALPEVRVDLATLKGREFMPFEEVFKLETQPEMVMTAHVVYPALDKGTPATLSSAVLKDLLRDEFGFRGIVITDAMEMKAITDRFPPDQAAVQALQAGVDILLYATDPVLAAAAYQGVLKAVKEGRISEARLAESVERVRKLRNRFRSIPWVREDDSDEILDLAHEQAFFESALDGLVLEGNAGVLSQIAGAAGPKVIVLPRELDEARPLDLDVVREQLEPLGFTLVEVSAKPTAEEIAAAESRAAGASVVVVGTASRGLMAEENRRLVAALTKSDVIKVGVALLDPADAEQMMTANCRIKTFGFAVPQLWAMCQKIID
jgi:beta-N-acetylhexosaminidase